MSWTGIRLECICRALRMDLQSLALRWGRLPGYSPLIQLSRPVDRVVHFCCLPPIPFASICHFDQLGGGYVLLSQLSCPIVRAARLQSDHFCVQLSCPSARVAQLLPMHSWSSTCFRCQLRCILLHFATSTVFPITLFTSFESNSSRAKQSTVRELVDAASRSSQTQVIEASCTAQSGQRSRVKNQKKKTWQATVL